MFGAPPDAGLSFDALSLLVIFVGRESPVTCNQPSSMPRIVSFLPSATEMVCALGMEEQLVGITHECDYPESVKSKPVVVRNVLPIETMTQSEIDRAVADRLREGLSLYEIDEDQLAALAPDVILTQNLCQVCAPSG